MRKANVEALTSADFEQRIAKPRILSWDIETAANQGDFWRSPWQTSIIETTADTHMISWSVKVLGGKQITKALPDYKGYEPGSRDDKALVTELWSILETADILVHHHGDVFDLPYTKGRAVINGLMPNKKFQTYDTKKVAKRNFGFTSNKLNDIARLCGFEPKIPIHYEVWKGCRSGNMKHWALMKKYNAHDVKILEQVYLKFRAWDNQHPNLNIISNTEQPNCPSCGSPSTRKRGWDATRTGHRQAHGCNDCGRRFQGAHRKVTDYR
jgi:DNA polymerase elongation subunit (family B)